MISPCQKKCELVDQHCMGCGRSVDEIRHWTHTPEQEQKRLMAALPHRVSWFHEDLSMNLSPHMTLRRLSWEDAPAVRVHLLSLSPEDRCTRFGRFMKDQSLEDWVQTLRWSEDLLLGVFDTSHAGARLVAWSMVSVVRFAPFQVEWSISVAKSHRGQGWAHRLLSDSVELIRRHHGTGTLSIIAEPTCAPMMRLIQAFGGVTHIEDGQVHGQIHIASPEPEHAHIAFPVWSWLKAHR